MNGSLWRDVPRKQRVHLAAPSEDDSEVEANYQIKSDTFHTLLSVRLFFRRFPYQRITVPVSVQNFRDLFSARSCHEGLIRLWRSSYTFNRDISLTDSIPTPELSRFSEHISGDQIKALLDLSLSQLG